MTLILLDTHDDGIFDEQMFYSDEINTLIDVAFEASKIAFWHIGSSGDVRWHKNLNKLYQVRAGQSLLPEDFIGLVHPEDSEDFQAKTQEAIVKTEPFEVSARVLIGGRYQWVQITGVPDGNGGVYGTTQNLDHLILQIKDQEQILKIIKTIAENGDLAKVKELLKDFG